VVIGALAVLAVAEFSTASLHRVVPFIAFVVVAAVAYRSLLTWRTLLAALVLVIMFLPIRRYSSAIHLGVQLEPYRLLVAFVLLGWTFSLLVDRRVRLRRTGLEPPLVLLVAGALASVVANQGRINALGVNQDVVKNLTFLFSFLIVTYLIVSVVRTLADIQFLLKVIVICGCVVSVFASIEARSGYNVFNSLGGVVPLLGSASLGYGLTHDYANRAYASAQHPIALGAALVMLLPLSVYLARSTRRAWWLSTAVLALGIFASRSRTPIVMLVIVVCILLVFRGKEMKGLWPALIPIALALHFAMPGTVASLKGAFLPKGGVISQQAQGSGSTSSGRLAHIAPGIREWSDHAVFGEGFGSRVTEGSGPIGHYGANAAILDNQWLSFLLETGIVGLVAWIWLFARFGRAMAHGARDPSPIGWLYAGLAASVIAYAIGMVTFDAFSFVQVTFLLFVLLGLGGALTSISRGAPQGLRDT
jgi:polysaccharide biosynthesis protein PslJ